MDIYNTIKLNYLRYTKYSLLGFVGFAIIELLTYLLYPRLSDIIAVLIALVGSSIAGYFLTKKYVAGVKTHNVTAYIITSIFSISLLDLLQWLFFVYMHINPLLGNVLASVINSPINYTIQMIKVWKVPITV